MKTSSNGNLFRVTGSLQRPVTRSFDVFFDLCLNKRLSKQSWGWWFETPSCSWWRHCNGWWCFIPGLDRFIPTIDIHPPNIPLISTIPTPVKIHIYQWNVLFISLIFWVVLLHFDSYNLILAFIKLFVNHQIIFLQEINWHQSKTKTCCFLWQVVSCHSQSLRRARGRWKIPRCRLTRLGIPIIKLRPSQSRRSCFCNGISVYGKTGFILKRGHANRFDP